MGGRFGAGVNFIRNLHDRIHPKGRAYVGNSPPTTLVIIHSDLGRGVLPNQRGPFFLGWVLRGKGNYLGFSPILGNTRMVTHSENTPIPLERESQNMRSVR